jgi:G3E family GTPase
MPSRYIMIGGFLGAGKTTAIGQLALKLRTQGLTVGLITNDQGSDLVDTRMLRSLGFATEEIPGGCFCCRFNSLTDAARKLTASTRPDVFIAEPVGSCTDLVATVTYPLRRIYGNDFLIAPMSVLVDPIRVRRVLGLVPGGTFSEKVIYIYRKQLEEADIIVISKCEVLSAADSAELHEALRKEFPQAEIIAASARTDVGLDTWLAKLMTGEQAQRAVMPMDYDVYAEGEALLGWLNATVSVTHEDEFDAGLMLKALCADVQQRLLAQQAEIAHLKMTYSPDESLAGEIASVNLVRSDFVPELGMELDEPTSGGQLIINLRAELAPDALAAAVRESLDLLARDGLYLKLEHEEHFRPGRPTPTHRDA